MSRIVDGPDIHVEAQIKVLVSDVVSWLVPISRAGIVDDKVDLSIRVCCLLQKGFPVVVLGDVGEVKLAIQFLGSFGANVFDKIGDDDLRTVLNEGGGNPLAESLA